MAASWFSDVEVASAIEVFALTQSYNEDQHPQKVNLGVGGRLCVFGRFNLYACAYFSLRTGQCRQRVMFTDSYSRFGRPHPNTDLDSCI